MSLWATGTSQMEWAEEVRVSDPLALVCVRGEVGEGSGEERVRASESSLK